MLDMVWVQSIEMGSQNMYLSVHRNGSGELHCHEMLSQTSEHLLANADILWFLVIPFNLLKNHTIVLFTCSATLYKDQK